MVDGSVCASLYLETATAAVGYETISRVVFHILVEFGSYIFREGEILFS